VATDLAARGFDLPGLELVLHADLPGSAELLLHRSGRTGRAGRGGLAVLVVTPGERRRAEALASRAGLRISWVPAPDRAEIVARDLERMLAEAAEGERDADDAAAAARLLDAHGAEAIAAAYRRLWASARPAPGRLTGGR
jgi:ATP-dependent RNA helicase DeaD